MNAKLLWYGHTGVLIDSNKSPNNVLSILKGQNVMDGKKSQIRKWIRKLIIIIIKGTAIREGWYFASVLFLVI